MKFQDMSDEGKDLYREIMRQNNEAAKSQNYDLPTPESGTGTIDVWLTAALCIVAAKRGVDKIFSK